MLFEMKTAANSCVAYSSFGNLLRIKLVMNYPDINNPGFTVLIMEASLLWSVVAVSAIEVVACPAHSENCACGRQSR